LIHQPTRVHERFEMTRGTTMSDDVIKRRIMVAGIALVAGVLTSGAAAQCTVPNDLQEGVSVTFYFSAAPNGSVSGRVERLDRRVCWAQIARSDGVPIWVNLAQVEAIAFPPASH
jgi:hypothetical protein